MTDSTPDAPVSPERLDEMIKHSERYVLSEWESVLRELKALRERCERNCIWTPLPDEIDAHEGCVSIHHVGRDDEGPTLPAFCEDCGGAVVVGSPSSASEQQPSEPKA